MFFYSSVQVNPRILNWGSLHIVYREDLKELSEEGTYLALQELDNPFQDQTEDDALTMTVRYGYEVIDDKPTLHHHIILEAKENQVIVAPMDGKVSLDGENIIITSGKGLNKSIEKT